jgi:dipeptidyl aminopeptidase/acylaminoacyl peptidase
MTTNDAFSERLAIWLRESSERVVPDHLDEVLVVTVATRQRPWWSSPERWLPMATTFSGRIANSRPMLSLLLVLALLAALVGAAIFVGANLRQPVIHTGLAGNGRILAVDSNSALVSYAADGGDRRQLATIAGGTPGISISPDGTQLAYRRTDPQLGYEIRRLADQTVVEVRPSAEELQEDAPAGRLTAGSSRLRAWRTGSTA